MNKPLYLTGLALTLIGMYVIWVYGLTVFIASIGIGVFLQIFSFIPTKKLQPQRAMEHATNRHKM